MLPLFLRECFVHIKHWDSRRNSLLFYFIPVPATCNSSLLTNDGRLLSVGFQNLFAPTVDREPHFKTIRLSNTSPKKVNAVMFKVNGSDIITKFTLRYSSGPGKWNDVHDGQGEAKVSQIRVDDQIYLASDWELGLCVECTAVEPSSLSMGVH